MSKSSPLTAVCSKEGPVGRITPHRSIKHMPIVCRAITALKRSASRRKDRSYSVPPGFRLPGNEMTAADDGGEPGRPTALVKAAVVQLAEQHATVRFDDVIAPQGQPWALSYDLRGRSRWSGPPCALLGTFPAKDPRPQCCSPAPAGSDTNFCGILRAKVVPLR